MALLTPQQFASLDGADQIRYVNSINPDPIYTTDRDAYYRVPTASGYIYVKSLPETGESSPGLSQISASQLYSETGIKTNEYAAEAQAAQEAAQEAERIRQARVQHDVNLRELTRKQQESVNQFGQQYAGIDESKRQLGLSKEAGMESNQAYFGAISPDAYQSQVQNYNQKVLDAYNEGMNTVANNKSQIDFAKGMYEQRLAEQLAGENSFSPTTGSYTGSYVYNAGLAPQAPTINAVNTGSAYGSAAKLPGTNFQWSPNSMAIKNQETNDPYSFLKK